nr:MAG TPA: hypothetical protein [Caudoviricetes sp.]
MLNFEIVKQFVFFEPHLLVVAHFLNGILAFHQI